MGNRKWGKFSFFLVAQQGANRGFTLPEILVTLTVIGILIALAFPSWLAFVNTQRLKTAQDEVYYAIRQAQRQASKEKLNWQASFREQNGIVQWSIHPASVNPSLAKWNDLDSNVRIDEETTLPESNGVKYIRFDYKGNVIVLPRRITLSSKNGGKAKRCVFVSTILGAMRTAKENARPNDGKYCY